MAPAVMKAEWSCALTKCGGPYAIVPGTLGTGMWCVGNLDFWIKVVIAGCYCVHGLICPGSAPREHCASWCLLWSWEWKGVPSRLVLQGFRIYSLGV